jgi:hypothetical protein
MRDSEEQVTKSLRVHLVTLFIVVVSWFLLPMYFKLMLLFIGYIGRYIACDRVVNLLQQTSFGYLIHL